MTLVSDLEDYYASINNLLRGYGVHIDIYCRTADMLIKRGKSQNEFYCRQCNKVLSTAVREPHRKTMCKPCHNKIVNLRTRTRNRNLKKRELPNDRETIQLSA